MCRDRGLTVHGSEAGLYLWIEIPSGEASDVAYAAKCREAGVLVAPGSFFAAASKAGLDRFVRLALVPTVDECRAAAEVWPRA